MTNEDLVLEGSDLNDTLEGDIGNDLLFGNSGKDILKGKSGDDLLRGNSGKDRLMGSTGDDTLAGGLGVDTLIGGGGKDTFIIQNNSFNRHRDIIRDFRLGVDLFKLSGSLTFEELTIVNNKSFTSAVIKNSNGNILAVVNGIDAELIDRSDFL